MKAATNGCNVRLNGLTGKYSYLNDKVVRVLKVNPKRYSIRSFVEDLNGENLHLPYRFTTVTDDMPDSVTGAKMTEDGIREATPKSTGRSGFHVGGRVRLDVSGPLRNAVVEVLKVNRTRIVFRGFNNESRIVPMNLCTPTEDSTTVD